jgi:hypothetical protein
MATDTKNKEIMNLKDQLLQANFDLIRAGKSRKVGNKRTTINRRNRRIKRSN